MRVEYAKITRRFVRNPAFFQDKDTLCVPKQPPPPGTPAAVFRHDADYQPLPDDNEDDTKYTNSNSPYVEVEIPAGSAVLLHGAVVHRSPANKSARSRWAYAFHVVDSAPGVAYSHENWLQSKLAGPLY